MKSLSCWHCFSWSVPIFFWQSWWSHNLPDISMPPRACFSGGLMVHPIHLKTLMSEFSQSSRFQFWAGKPGYLKAVWLLLLKFWPQTPEITWDTPLDPPPLHLLYSWLIWRLRQHFQHEDHNGMVSKAPFNNSWHRCSLNQYLLVHEADTLQSTMQRFIKEWNHKHRSVLRTEPCHTDPNRPAQWKRPITEVQTPPPSSHSAAMLHIFFSWYSPSYHFTLFINI